MATCQPEIDAYCSQVTLGEGRLLACFYAHEDKLSGRCQYALYEGAARLEQFAAAVTHLAVECMDDLETQLKAARADGARFVMIATDGVFSMDGDIARLDHIVELAEQYEALVMVDDSHATGVIGAASLARRRLQERATT